jgi:hypothetical protein
MRVVFATTQTHFNSQIKCRQQQFIVPGYKVHAVSCVHENANGTVMPAFLRLGGVKDGN